MNKVTATTIVKSVNPSADDTIINDLLEDSKGTKAGVAAYRPYIVAARTLSLNPPNADLKKADTAEWFDWQRRIKDLLETQALSDGTIEGIPVSWMVNTGDTIPLAAISSSAIFI